MQTTLRLHHLWQSSACIPQNEFKYIENGRKKDSDSCIKLGSIFFKTMEEDGNQDLFSTDYSIGTYILT